MKIGLLSDTHGNAARTLEAIRLLGQHSLSAVLHAGDIGSPEIIRMLDAWPVHLVMGNVDVWVEADLKSALLPHHHWHGAAADIVIGERRIAMHHGHKPGPLAAAIASGEFHLVVTGHTHRAESRRAGKTLVVNPGALHRTSAPSVAVVDLFQLQATIYPLRPE